MAETRVCPWWLAYFFDNPLRRLFQKPEEILSPYLKAGMSALDIGCGMGFYSIAMAKIVGPQGKIISVDLQQKMLDILLKRAKRAGVSERIKPNLAERGNIGVNEKVHFALAMWMVHEVPGADRFLGQVKACLIEKGKFLIAEPKMHVSASDFQKTLRIAEATGLKVVERPKIGISHAAVFEPI